MRKSALSLAVAAYALSVVLATWLLPARVPLHFGASGAAERYGSRAEALVLFVVLALVLLAVLAGSRHMVRRSSLQLVQVPHPGYWKRPEHEAELRAKLRADLDQFWAATFVFCTIVVATTTWVSRSDGEDRLPAVFFAAFAAYLLWIAWWVWHMTARRYRPPV